MFKSYLKTAFRHIRRQKGYAFINIAGLSIGLACSFLILLWVRDEVSYDRFHAHGDDLYRAMRHVKLGGQTYTWSSMPKPVADVLPQAFPEVEHVILMSWPERQLLRVGEQTFREVGYYAGPAFFQAFSFPLLAGDPAAVLTDPDAIVLSDGLARKLFGADWQAQGVVGRTVNIDHRRDFRVTGVFADVPDNSSLQFDYVVAVEDFLQRNTWVEHWGNSGMEIYVQLKPGTPVDVFNRKVAGLIDQHHEGANATVFLKPFEELRLYADYRDGRQQGGRIVLLRVFAVVAVFLVLIAAINFMNLATARSAQRAKEIGVRKAIGAAQPALVRQFLAESLLLAGLAFVLAMGLVLAVLPLFNTLTGKAIGPADLDPAFLLAVLGIAAVTGVLAGSYPAFYLAAFNPVAILRGTFRQRPGAARMRKGLVVFQFALSTLLIVCTAAVYLQVRFILTKDLGVDRGNLAYIVREGAVRENYDAFRQELLRMPGIENVSTSSQNPLNVGSSTTDPTWAGKDPDDNTLFHIINANYDFVETMRMTLVAGRTFSEAFAADSVNYVINERTAAAMGKENPVGETLEFWGQKGQVIGVVKDFHMASLGAPIEPTIIRLDPRDTWMLWVRTQAGRTQEGLASLEALYKQFNPGYPLEIEFLDQRFEDMYRGVIVMGKLANGFALIGIFISCLGLFGLASFTAEQRTKEIGVRKVLGASVARLVMLLSLDFTKLVLVGFVLAAPLAYLVVGQWLDQFEYRVEIPYTLFVLAGVVALAVAWLTVGYQSVRAARANPVRSLRLE